MDGFIVVPMGKRHIARLAEIERLCFAKPWSEQGLESELSNGTAHFFVAELGGKAAGYIGLHTMCGEGYLANIAVHPDFRRNGIARMLLQTAEGYALAMGLSFLTLEVRKSNAAARALYRSEGFKEAGVRKNFYTAPTEDALILTLRFDEDKKNMWGT